MASFILPSRPLPSDYRGLEWIFEFTNRDGDRTRTNCGQAAAATFLTHHGAYSTQEAANLMALLEREHPPDNLLGYLGTSRRRIERICRAHALPLREVRSEADLRLEVELGNPVMVMLGMPAGRLWGWDLPGGHWMVVYGFNHEFVYLTNFGRMAWPEFHKGWRSWVAWLIRMRCVGLVCDRVASHS